MNRVATKGRLAGFVAMALMASMAGFAVRPTVAFADDHEKMEEAMDGLNTAHKKLKKQVADKAQVKTSIDLVREMQKHTVSAKILTPDRAGKTPESERVKFLASYQKAMNGLLVELLNIEDALLDGDTAKAEAGVKKLDDIKKKGHEQFQVQE